ncbi:MAG: hypothetical protein QF864_00205 [SAR202 cluster bacterium]|jgi:hypothetical protein|nr:hypothetical protein [SAR202 cluster bacterium]
MKKLLSIIILGLLCCNISYAENCPDNKKIEGLDNETIKSYAEFWSNYYVPEEAYDFGINIQNLLKAKNLKTLFELVEGELLVGPKKSLIKDKSFDEIFSEEWVTSVLSSSSNCYPVGWRGFTLGNGNIWYAKEDNGWVIISMNGVNN